MNPSWVLSDQQRRKRFKKYREADTLSPDTSQVNHAATTWKSFSFKMWLQFYNNPFPQQHRIVITSLVRPSHGRMIIQNDNCDYPRLMPDRQGVPWGMLSIRRRRMNCRVDNVIPFPDMRPLS